MSNTLQYVADGFVEDCQNLIHQCSQVQRLSYEKFCDVWKNMNLFLIFHGRHSSAEIAELSEEVIYIAKYFMLNNTNNFEESVAGLFLVYSLLNLQPYPGFAALRLAQEDLPGIFYIKQMAHKQRRRDVLYILGSVLVKGPCQFHAAARERGLELPLRKYLECFNTIDKMGSSQQGVFGQRNEELDIIKELNTLERLYTEAKKSIAENKDPSLNYAKDNMSAELEKSFNSLLCGSTKSTETSTKKDSNAGNVNSIKQKAMKVAVQPMQHLVGINERKAEARSPEKRTDIKTKSGRVKSGSPRKIATSSKKNQLKPIRKSIAFESDEEFDVTLSDEKEDSESEPDIDLDLFLKPQTEIEIENITTPFVQNESGERLELEIIDQMEPKNNLKPTSDASKQKIEDQKGLKRKKLKQRHQKSKFRRLGMTSIVDVGSPETDMQ